MIRDLNIRQVKNEPRQARQQLASRVGVREEARVEQVADAMDQIRAAEAREFALRNLDRDARQLRQVEDALQRIDAGDFGVCADCEEEIGLNRLRAVAWAQRCVKCQELADERGFGADRADFKRLAHAA